MNPKTQQLMEDALRLLMREGGLRGRISDSDYSFVKKLSKTLPMGGNNLLRARLDRITREANESTLAERQPKSIPISPGVAVGDIVRDNRLKAVHPSIVVNDRKQFSVVNCHPLRVYNGRYFVVADVRANVIRGGSALHEQLPTVIMDGLFCVHVSDLNQYFSERAYSRTYERWKLVYSQIEKEVGVKLPEWNRKVTPCVENKEASNGMLAMRKYIHDLLTGPFKDWRAVELSKLLDVPVGFVYRWRYPKKYAACGDQDRVIKTITTLVDHMKNRAA